MELREALEICITRHELGRGCINCRFKGEDCVKIHREAVNKIKEVRQFKKELSEIKKGE